MKYAIITLSGALGMGLSIIAEAIGLASDAAEAYAGISCCVMILGVLCVLFSSSKKDEA